jgi:hypothetical protein
MLEMGLGEPDIARVPEATPADALRVGTLDPCSRRIWLAELFGRLPLTGLLQRLIRLTCAECLGSWALRCARDSRHDPHPDHQRAVAQWPRAPRGRVISARRIAE